MKKIRILHMLPDLKVGGGQVLVLRNIRAMDRSRFENHVCYVRSDDEMAAAYLAADISIYTLGVPYGKGKILSQLAGVFRRAFAYIRRNRIDIIHTNNTTWDMRVGLIAAWRCKVPVVNTFHSMVFGNPRSLGRRFGGKLVREVVGVSRLALEEWRPYFSEWGIGPEHARVIYPGLDVSEFPTRLLPERERSLRSELGLETAWPIMLNVGRLAWGKGHKFLIDAMAEVAKHWPEACLLVVGDGPEGDKIIPEIERCGLKNAIRPLGNRHDVADLLALSDLFLFPSLNEGFGLAPLEAMAAQKAVVAFGIPSLEEFIVDGESGILVPLGDSEAYTRAVVDLLRDGDKRLAMGRAAREAVEKGFSIDRSARQLEQVYLSAVALGAAVGRCQIRSTKSEIRNGSTGSPP